MKADRPGRPLIRISSTLVRPLAGPARPCARRSSADPLFALGRQFWHLSSDEPITPLPALSKRAAALRARTGETPAGAGDDDDAYAEWADKLVGEQVQQCVPPPLGSLPPPPL